MIQRMIAAGLCGVFGLVLAPACDGLGLGGEEVEVSRRQAARFKELMSL